MDYSEYLQDIFVYHQYDFYACQPEVFYQSEKIGSFYYLY